MNELIGIDCRKFNIDDFPIYQSWFRDPELNQQLGPMDETWLKHIISDKTGAQYSFFFIRYADRCCRGRFSKYAFHILLPHRYCGEADPSITRYRNTGSWAALVATRLETDA